MHVAVAKFHLFDERTHFDHFFNNERVGFPNVQAAEEGQGICVNTIACHRVDDVGIFQAISFAGQEVVYTIGWRAVNYACTCIGTHVFSKVHGAQAVVEGVLE